MAAGKPVITSNATSIPDQAGDAAVYFDPNNAEEMAARIVEVLSDPALQEKMIVRGLERVKQFDSIAIAKQYQELYHAVAKQPLA
jgi:glycosyltransferase involved in cell wall biosynthesis